jgi:serine/threonine protein kinase
MLSDRVLHHLRGVVDIPDFSGTRYELMEEIGRGGMGVVYLAYDTVLNRNVALKILHGSEEARMLASLEHPGIVPVHDSGTLPDGRAYYAMKFVQGVRLDDYVSSTPPLAGRLRTFLRVCEPVAFAHARGLVHRDLKPENLMIGAFGEVLVMDWGVATRADAPPSSAAGTRGYMPPEQLQGIVNQRTDIYSLGKVLEYLLQPGDPKQVRAIAMKASDPEPPRRYANVLELTEDVTHFLDGQPVGAYPEPPLERVARWISRKRTLVILMLTYVIVRSVIFFFTRR